jgi:surface protein
MSTAIANIESGGGKYAPRYVHNGGHQFFYNYEGTELDHETSMLDTTYFTSMDSMFNACRNLISLNLSGWNTSNVTSMKNMFSCTYNLTELDLSGFDTSNVTRMDSMFDNCRQLKELDLSSFNTLNVTDMSDMFMRCDNLKKLDIRNFDFSNVTSYDRMFYGVPKDCLIIVKDDDAKTWLTGKFSTLTNIKTVAEYEASL